MSAHPPCSRKGPLLPACGLKCPRRVKRETTNSRFSFSGDLADISVNVPDRHRPLCVGVSRGRAKATRPVDQTCRRRSRGGEGAAAVPKPAGPAGRPLSLTSPGKACSGPISAPERKKNRRAAARTRQAIPSQRRRRWPVRPPPRLRRRSEQNHSTQDSHVVPHHGTNWAALRLTSQIGRDAVLSESYGRGYWYFSPRTKRTPAPLRQAVCPPTREPALKREAGKPTGPKDRKLVGARRGVHVLPCRQPTVRPLRWPTRPCFNRDRTPDYL